MTIPEPVSSVAAIRLASVDTLRGFSIFWLLGAEGAVRALEEMSIRQPSRFSTIAMILRFQFEHAPWEGFRFYDLIFPLLIFAAGISISLSLPRLIERAGYAAAHARVAFRFASLFVLGFLFNGGVSELWPDVRLLGVLQRIAICYLAASLILLYAGMRGVIAAATVLLVGYWAAMTFIAVPGVGAGSFGPDVNLANWFDAQYLPGRLWDRTRDPEGLLSTLPAIASCLIGVSAGLFLNGPAANGSGKSVVLILVGGALAMAGYLWGLQFPVIKAIWTSSFVLVAGGYSLMLLGAFHQIVDVWGLRVCFSIFIWLGANALALYFINGIASFERFAVRFVGGDIGLWLDGIVTPGAGRFVAHALGLFFAIAIARELYRRRIFIRV